MEGVELTDKGLDPICQLRNLTSLNVGATKISDEGLKSIASLKKLKELWLYLISA
jgi:hypothetical protein